MSENRVNLDLGGGSLLQIASRTLVQSMSYIIDTPDNECVVIDGGNEFVEDADNLYRELSARNKKVKYWFITHAHNDHLGTLLYFLEHIKPFDINIENLCFDFPDEDYLSTREDYDDNLRFLKAVKEQGIKTITTKAGDIFNCGGIEIEVLNDHMESKGFETLNSTGIMLLVHFPKRDILFLGDMSDEAENMYLEKYGSKKIRCDIVQMAHHGQNGVSKSFYELIMPKICLYPTPKWLWENNMPTCLDPETAGKGPFNTLLTRQWMEELGVQASYTQVDGDWLFY